MSTYDIWSIVFPPIHHATCRLLAIYTSIFPILAILYFNFCHIDYGSNGRRDGGRWDGQCRAEPLLFTSVVRFLVGGVFVLPPPFQRQRKCSRVGT
jgi:hypothetical protein